MSKTLDTVTATWEGAVELEPCLRQLERLAEATAAAGTEPASWPYFRKRLQVLVGYNARKPELTNVAWQRVVHARIKAALGGPRG